MNERKIASVYLSMFAVYMFVKTLTQGCGSRAFVPLAVHSPQMTKLVFSLDFHIPVLWMVGYDHGHAHLFGHVHRYPCLMVPTVASHWIVS